MASVPQKKHDPADMWGQRCEGHKIDSLPCSWLLSPKPLLPSSLARTGSWWSWRRDWSCWPSPGTGWPPSRTRRRGFSAPGSPRCVPRWTAERSTTEDRHVKIFFGQGTHFTDLIFHRMAFYEYSYNAKLTWYTFTEDNSSNLCNTRQNKSRFQLDSP